MDLNKLADEVVDLLRLEEYGIGVPAAFIAVGVGLLYAAAPGMGMFESLTSYGKFGLLVLLLLTVLSIAAGGYTYNEIDTGWWLLTREEDGPGADPLEDEVADAEPTGDD